MTTETNAPAVTVVPAAAAKGINKRTAPMTARRLADEKTKSTKSKRTDAKTPAAPKAKAAGTFTTVELAAEKGVNAKTLRARIRRNIDDWTPLFKNGEKHVFADNKMTRGKIDALL